MSTATQFTTRIRLGPRSSRPRRTVARGIAAAVALVAASLAFAGVAAPPAGAIGTTYTVTEVDLCGGPGTFEAALAAANANPGTDTISFAAGLKLSTRPCASLVSPIHEYPLSATESVNIVGNGATVYGDQIYVNAQGRVNDPNQCPAHTAGTHEVALATGFLEVGTFDADNSAVTVNVDHLNFDTMPSLFQVEKNASLSLQDSDAEKTYSFNQDCSRTPIFSNDGNVALTRVLFRDSSAPTTQRNRVDSTTAVVSGPGTTGVLTMDDVKMYYNFAGRAVVWRGSSAKIVSSQFYESGGLWLDATSSEVVNTALHADTRYATDRVIATQGHLRTDASTFYWSEPVCDRCAAPSLGFATGSSGTIDLHTTAIGAGANFAGRNRCCGATLPRSRPTLSPGCNRPAPRTPSRSTPSCRTRSPTRPV